MTATALPPLPPTFATTRESLRTLACYVIAPARKARTGRIGLRPTGDGFGTPRFDDGSRIVVRGDLLVHELGSTAPSTAPPVAAPITTVRAVAQILGVEVMADPGVGHDLPPFEPDGELSVDPHASFALGAWYAFGQQVLDQLSSRVPLGTVSEPQLWPEHFDLAVTITLPNAVGANVGFSPGDSFADQPYVYVGPHDTTGLGGDYWNAPFGAVLLHSELLEGDGAVEATLAFVEQGLGRLA